MVVVVVVVFLCDICKSSVTAKLMPQLLTMATCPSHYQPFLSRREIANNVFAMCWATRIHLMQVSNFGYKGWIGCVWEGSLNSDSLVTTEETLQLVITTFLHCTNVAVVADPLPGQFHFSSALHLKVLSLAFSLVNVSSESIAWPHGKINVSEKCFFFNSNRRLLSVCQKCSHAWGWSWRFI